RSALLSGVGVALVFVAGQSQVAGGETGPPVGPASSTTVVELFTSQGCSSCPPADAFLRELSRRDDVIALSFHVTYWDYIGWRDPFASHTNTSRQRAYGRALHQRYVYTPEMVIDGIAAEVGSRRELVSRIIERESRRKRLRVPVTATALGDDSIAVAIPAADYEGTAAVWLIEYDREHVTHVERGENEGRTLTNANVVRDIHRIGSWTGEALQVSVPLSQLTDEDRDGCVVILQSEEAGPILGAAKVSLREMR
ncbi:MAG: DUF1223 domain-containing protein, partial [Alphaproteobacteria bacterium]